MPIDDLFVAMAAARAKSPSAFAQFLVAYVNKVFPVLHAYGYQGDRVTEKATLEDFDRAYEVWRKGVMPKPSMPRAGSPRPMSETEARRRMWATAADDPVAAVVIGVGALTADTLGRAFGFQQDPKKAAASAKVISNVVETVGSLNNPHEVNELVRKGEVPQDRIKEVAGDGIRDAGKPGYGSRYPNSGPPGIDCENCGQTTGAVLEGRGGNSTSFSVMASHAEGRTYSPVTLQLQFKLAGNFVGEVKQAKTIADLAAQLTQFPVGTNVALTYRYARSDGTIDGHVIAVLVGKGKSLLFVETQTKPLTRVPGPPANAFEFAFFAVTPKPR